MTTTHLLLRDQARGKLLAGVDALADAVRPTLGPKARCVLIERRWGSPLVCNDGVTIAKQVELPDHEENLGARLLREAAVRTGEDVGDGTTTATLLAQAIYAEGVRNVVAGASAIELKRGIDRGHELVAAELARLSRPADTRERREQIATVAAHGEVAIGRLVAEATERVGAEGVVSLEEAKGTETELEVVEGMQLDQGYLSPYFVTEPDRMEAVLHDVAILLHEKRIASAQDLIPLLEEVVKAGRALLVVAEAVEGEALATLVVNKLRGTFSCAAVKGPGYGERRKEMLQDLAVLTGGRVCSEELGGKLESFHLADLGAAKRVVLDKESTTIIGGGGDPAAIEGRCAELRRRIAAEKSDYEREKLEGRLAKLAGGVAVIRVGAPSEAEMKSLKEAYDDAVNATRAAVAEGVVPGGGVALVRAIGVLEQEAAREEGDRRTGLLVLRRALEAPIRTIAANSGADGGVVVERVRAAENPAFGFDAARGAYGDLLEAGVVDPTKVVRVALRNAVSVATTLLLTEATLTEVEEPEKERRTELE